jgi:hydroxypyruvate isomerase
MPRFSANLSFLFNEVSFLSRFENAAKAGFTGVEYPFPEEYSPEQLTELLEKYSLEQVLFNLPSGRTGERGIACLPGREAEFQEGVGRALTLAKALKCTRINCLVGNTPKAVSSDRIRRTLVTNIRFAAAAFQKEGIRLLVEALNGTDAPGFYLLRSSDAFDLIKEVNHPNLYFQYDIYHMQVSEGNLSQTIRDNLPRIAHMQLADVPGRHEPGTGEINFQNVLRFIDEAGYNGWIGCEYKPATTTEAGLGWMKSFTAKGARLWHD